MTERFFKGWFIFVGGLTVVMLVGGLAIGIKACNYVTSGQAAQDVGEVLDKER